MTPYGWCSITTRFEPIQQTTKVLLQIQSIFLRRLPVDPDRPVLARALIRIPHPFLIEIMIQ
jgi:hypothetical protein